MKKLLLTLLLSLLPLSVFADSDWVDGKQFNDFEITQWNGIFTPSVSPINSARIFYSATQDTLRLSVNHGSYLDILTNATGITSETDPTVDTSAKIQAILGDIYLKNDGDTATGDYTFDTNTLHIDSVNHKVGIGTTSPNQQLEITQNFRMPLTTNASQYGIIYKEATPFIHDFNYGDNGTVTTEGYNTFVGLNAGNLTMGSGATATYHSSYNTGIGCYSLGSNTTGYYNTGIGCYSLYANTTGFHNTGIGCYSLRSNTTGSHNTGIGYYPLRSNTTGFHNTGIGCYSLRSNTTGYYNTGIGCYSLYANTTGFHNTGIGCYSLYANTTGFHNTGIGYYSLGSNTTGSHNTGIGYYPLRSNTTGYYNTGIGCYSLYANTKASNNSAYGNNSLYSSVATYGGRISNVSDYSGTVPGTVRITYVGDVLPEGTTSVQITGTTDYNGIFTATKIDSTKFYITAAYVSSQTGTWSSDAYNNSAFGTNSGYSLTTGSHNVFLGYNAGYHASQLVSADNSIAIGANAYTTASNQVVIGDENITETLLRGNVGIAGTLGVTGQITGNLTGNVTGNADTATTATTANAGDSATAFFSSGTIEHEYGGLEANVSAYNGLVKISGGSTSAVTLGIADTNIAPINAADVANNDYAKFTATGLVGRSYAEVLSDIGAQATLTNSAGLLAALNDETGTGLAVFNNSPTLSGAIDAGGATSLEIPNGANPTCDAAGEIAVNTTDKTLELHNGTTQVAFPTIHIAQGTFDLAAQYDVDSDLWLIDLNADSYPHGIYITKIYVDCTVADPTNEIDANLMYCDAVADGAFPGANATLIKAIDTTTGNFADAAVNTAVATGKTIYIDMDADPTDANVQYHIRIHYYIPVS